MTASFHLAFCYCLVFVCVTIRTGTSQDCITSCDALADRVAALEEKWAKLGSLFSDESCPDGNPEPVYQCLKGMASPSTPPRVSVKILDGNTEALCDTETDGGGWIIIQRRADGVENFYRDWETYKQGFGTVEGDYWLGNEAIHNLTSTGTYELRVDMKVTNGTNFYAHYTSFSVGDENSGYKLLVGGVFSGDVPNKLNYHNQMKFSTFDRDNDVVSTIDCAVMCESGWWFRSCRYVNLNGKWGPNNEGFSDYQKAVLWNDAHPQYGPYLAFTEMKIRRL